MQRCMLVAGLVFALGAGASGVQAQDHDGAAPSLAVEADTDPPGYVFSLTADALGLVLGHYALSFEIAFAPAHAVWLSPSYDAVDGASGFGLEAGYHLWPLAEGTEGLFLGPVLGAARASSDQESATVLSVAAEIGWQVVWGGFAIAAGAGATLAYARSDSRETTEVIPRVRISLGWSWT